MTEMSPGRLVALALAERSSRLMRIARTVVDRQGVGSHTSRARGRGADFAEHRPYAAGDDLRRVDWRATARGQRVVVRRFDVERRTAVKILVDVSASMEFGTVEAPATEDVPATKSEAGAMVGAVLGLPMLRSGDRVSVSLVGETVRDFPARRGEGQLEALCTDLAQSIPALEPASALGEAVARSIASLGSRGRIVVLTDALDEDHAWIDRLAEARSRGYGTAVFQILDGSELELPFNEPAVFLEPELERAIRTDPRRVRKLYCQLIRQYVNDIRHRLVTHGTDHRLVRTGSPLRESLIAAPEVRR